MGAKILLVTTLDDTHRQPLLESEGYVVKTVPLAHVFDELNSADYEAALVVKERDAGETLALCEEMKKRFPGLQVAILAQRAEYVPATSFVDIVIRQQHSPQMFLTAVRKMLERGIEIEKSRPAAEGT